jgi:hypothetical protein
MCRTIGGLKRRNRLQFSQDSLNFLGLLSLNGADGHIFSALVTAPRFIEHAVGLANAGRVA